MSVPAELLHYEQSWREAAAQLPGAAEHRRAALGGFLRAGFPDRADEAWKYTDLRAIRRRAFALATRPDADMARVSALGFTDLAATRLCYANGHLIGRDAPPAAVPGLTVDSLAGRWEAEPQLLTGLAPGVLPEPRFAELNTAFASDGALIRVPDGCVLEQPIYLLFASFAAEPAVVCHPRIRIELGRASHAVVIEHYVGEPGAANLSNTVTEIDCADGARLEHYRIQDEAPDSFHLGVMHARLARDGVLTSHNIALGAKLARLDLSCELLGPGAEVTLDGLYFAGDRQHIDNHTRIDHREARTLSREDYRGVVDGRGRAVFNGKVVVHPGAQKIEAHQSNRNLLLAKDAEVDTKPELEIYADDVKCTHGATVGQLDQDALFYLLSRGIDPSTARALLTFAFADDVIARLALQTVRDSLERAVRERLPDRDRLEEFV